MRGTCTWVWKPKDHASLVPRLPRPHTCSQASDFTHSKSRKPGNEAIAPCYMSDSVTLLSCKSICICQENPRILATNFGVSTSLGRIGYTLWLHNLLVVGVVGFPYLDEY